MADKKLTDNEIITTLEGMASERAGDFFYDILDLINRQKAEIEKLKKGRYDFARMVQTKTITEIFDRLREMGVKGTCPHCGANIHDNPELLEGGAGNG